MKKRAFFIIAFFIAVILLFSIKMQFNTNPPERTLEKSFDCSGARIVSSEVYLTGKLDGTGNAARLKKLVLDVSEGLGVKDGLRFCNFIDNEDMAGIEMNHAVSSYRNVDINAIMSKHDCDGSNSYITVCVADTSENPRLADIRKSVGDILTGDGIEANVNSCITGNFADRLDNKQIDEVCARIFKRVGAQKVEGIKESSLTSISAYTPAIGKSVRVDGSRINLNLALRYNSYEGKTYIWLATPVITTEY